jgi:TPR repeat protein
MRLKTSHQLARVALLFLSLVLVIGTSFPGWAQGNSGELFLEGIKSLQSRDLATAAQWFRRAADLGHAKAQVNLGVQYERGDGVRRDYAEAVRWYRTAAAQGDAMGQNHLGTMYRNGKGVPQDYTEAARWYRQSAAQGYVEAQYNLGYMYEFGLGVPKDRGQAVAWYKKAGDQGYAEAAAAARWLRDPTNVSFRTPQERNEYLRRMQQEMNEDSDRFYDHYRQEQEDKRKREEWEEERQRNLGLE